MPRKKEVAPQTFASLKRQRRSRRSLKLVVFLFVVFGVLLLAVIFFMKPEVRRSQIVAKRIKPSIESTERERESMIPGIGERKEMEEKPPGEALPEGEKSIVPEQRRPTGRYTVNVASFEQRMRAERLTKELEKKGYKAFVEEAAIPKKGTWYRVAVGRFSSRGEAQTFARALKEKEKMDSFVRELKEAKK